MYEYNREKFHINQLWELKGKKPVYFKCVFFDHQVNTQRYNFKFNKDNISDMFIRHTFLHML